MLRSLQGVRPWTAKLGSERFEKLRVREQLVLNCFGQIPKFILEGSIKQHGPHHGNIMSANTYVINNILRPTLLARLSSSKLLYVPQARSKDGTQ